MANEFSRRSFLKGLLLLAGSAAVPVELVKVAESLYSTDRLLKKPPVFILIDGQILPCYGIVVEQPMGAVESFARSHPIHPGYYTSYMMQSPPDPPTITIQTNSIYYSFLKRLSQFDFSVTYDGCPFQICGKGYAEWVSSSVGLTRMDEIKEPLEFEFLADIEQWNNNG